MLYADSKGKILEAALPPRHECRGFRSEELMNKPVYVTQSSLPSCEDFIRCVRSIFASRHMTNGGRYATELEQALTRHLKAGCLALCANGTLALQLTIRLLGLHGKKVITTPYTYVATVSALLWEQCTPVFADIDTQTLCLSPEAVHRQLRLHPDAAGILPVHVYGNACDTAALESLGKEHGIPVLYDAAHAFGSRLWGKHLPTYGDAAICSFHATKLFHTVEGGCVVTPRPEDLSRLRLLRAFGHDGDNHQCLGINAKISELHAAMGVCLLPGMADILDQRRRKAAIYNEALEAGREHGLTRPRLADGLEWNHAYYPIIFPDNVTMRNALAALKARNIHPRRYFYPSLTRLPYLPGQSCPVAEDITERVLCLPFWPDMDEAIIRQISSILLEQWEK